MEQVAALLGARSREVVFTSGATEAIAAAVLRRHRGRARGASRPCGGGSGRALGRAPQLRPPRAHPGRAAIGSDGSTPTCCSPRSARTPPWSTCSGATTRSASRSRSPRWWRRAGSGAILVHVDAAQAAGHVPIDFGTLGADLMSVSAHKMGGPPGVGALLVRRGLRLPPLLVGGDQERARRAGFENVPAIIGWGAAATVLTDRLADEERLARRQTERILAAVPTVAGVEIYGDPDGRLPHIVCLGVAGIEPQAVLLGAGPGRHRRPLGQRVRLGGPGPLARPRGDGRRRPPLVAHQRRLEHHRRRRRRTPARATRRAGPATSLAGLTVAGGGGRSRLSGQVRSRGLLNPRSATGSRENLGWTPGVNRADGAALSRPRSVARRNGSP